MSSVLFPYVVGGSEIYGETNGVSAGKGVGAGGTILSVGMLVGDSNAPGE